MFLQKKNHYICIPEIDIDSVLKIDKKAYPQAYLEECKYKLKKRKLVSFIDSEIIDDSDIPIKDINSILKVNQKVCSQDYLEECDFITDSYNKNG